MIMVSVLLMAQFKSLSYKRSAIETKRVETSKSRNLRAIEEPVTAVASSTPTVVTALPKPQILQTQATQCHRNLPDEIFKSQSAEDKYLLRWFENLCGGSYIEMGALDGVRYSNSHVFNKGLDWKGVLIEAHPGSYERLQHNRPNEIAKVHAGACLEERDLHWIKHTDKGTPVSGFLEFASEEFKNKFWMQELIDAAELVRCRRLDNILREVVGKSFHFDFFSLDVEGAELPVLQSLNFDEYQFGVILVEADGTNERKDEAIKSTLERAGYRFVGLEKRSNWFVNKDFDRIYDNVIYDGQQEAAASE